MNFNLDRFIDAQEGQYESALSELKAGRKLGHWMWYVFPQVRGLGKTETSWRLGISGAAEARAYLAHPVLGRRLLACTRVVLTHRHFNLEDIFPPPDHLKFGSCMTLFALQEDAPSEFRHGIEAFLGGQMDAKTINLLQSPST
jgi:uncharacterized protein (DUF1810 family)